MLVNKGIQEKIMRNNVTLLLILKRSVRFQWVIWTALIAVFWSATSQASLMITPMRVVMDEKHRTAEVTLLNTTDSTKVYRILWQELAQTALGGYVELMGEGENEYQAGNMIQYSPRQVTIKPGKYQRIKLRLRMKGNMPDGEYRSHLMMKVTDTGIDPETLDVEIGSAHMYLIPKMSFSIPVIVRKGKNDSSTEITSVDLNTQNIEKSKMNVEISHKGVFSSFGNLFVYMKANSGSPVEKIGEAHSVALFRETQQRMVTIPLRVSNVPAGAVIQVVYDGEDEYEGQQLGTAAFTYQP